MSCNIRILKAEHGDAIIVSIPRDNILHHIVIDGGPSTKYSDEIVKEIEKLGQIDLMVLTHYDDDHIGGLIAYFEKHKNDKIPIRTCWVNCASDVNIKTGARISYTQARTLENLLTKVSQQQMLLWKDNIENSMEPVELGFCKIYVLSPSPDSLRINLEEYKKKEVVVTISAVSSRARQDEKLPLSELAKRPDIKHTTAEDIINKSSIAFILEAGSSKILFMGDADPWVVAEKLKAMGYSKDSPLKLDYWKLSHHGSRNNICAELLDLIICSNYIISTNGGSGRSCHPDRETLAKIICHPRRDGDDKVCFYFNYPLKEIQEKTGELLSDEEKKQNRCETYSDSVDYNVS